MHKSEKLIQQEVELWMSSLGGKIFTNDNGYGRRMHDTSQIFSYGLGEGTSDIIACMPVLVTEDMIGKKIGVFVGIEMKKESTKNRAKIKQKAFIKSILSCGGKAGIAYDIESAKEIINE